MSVVEIGMKLDKEFEYYDNLLKEKNFINDSMTIIHDIYYTNRSLEDLTENEMKNSCVRLRSCDNKIYIIQNNLIDNLNIKEVKKR